MKALVKDKNTVGVLDIQKPAITDDGDVLVRVALAGLCRTDVYVAEGIVKSKNPLVLGHEFSGIIEEVGDQVTGVQVGDRVAVMPVLPLANDNEAAPDYSQSTMVGIDHDGAFSEYILIPSTSVYKLPDNVSFKAGAYMEPIAASLAVMNAGLEPNQKGLIYGDNRISRLTERIMKANGLNNVDVYDHEDSNNQPLEPNSYDYIIETLATTETMTVIVSAVRPGGKIILKSRQHTPVAFDISELVKKDIVLQAVNYGDFSEAIDLVASGALQVDDLFGDVYALEQYKDVFAESKRGESKKLFFSAVEQDVWDC